MHGEPLRRTVTVTNPQGFHMRPMTAFVEAASKFPCSVAVIKGDSLRVDGKSMFGLLGLAAEQGTELILEISGPEAEQAMQALVEVLEKTFPDE